MTCRVHLMWLQNLKIPKDPFVDGMHELIKVVVDQEFVKPDGHASDILMQLFACSNCGRPARRCRFRCQARLVCAANDDHQEVADTWTQPSLLYASPQGVWRLPRWCRCRRRPKHGATIPPPVACLAPTPLACLAPTPVAWHRRRWLEPSRQRWYEVAARSWCTVSQRFCHRGPPSPSGCRGHHAW